MDVAELQNSQAPFPYLAKGSNGLPLPPLFAITLELMDRTFALLPGAENRSLSRITFGSQVYLIGIQLAQLTKRTTYNLYRSMRAHGVTIHRATSEQLARFKQTHVPFLTSRHNARSITFIQMEEALQFIIYGTCVYLSRLSFLQFSTCDNDNVPSIECC